MREFPEFPAFAFNVDVSVPIITRPTNTALNDSVSQAPTESSKALEAGGVEQKQLTPSNSLPANPVSSSASSRALPSRNSRDKIPRAERRTGDMTSAAAAAPLSGSSARIIRHQNELQHEASQSGSAQQKVGGTAELHEFEEFYKDGEPDALAVSEMHISGAVCAASYHQFRTCNQMRNHLFAGLN